MNDELQNLLAEKLKLENELLKLKIAEEQDKFETREFHKSWAKLQTEERLKKHNERNEKK